MGRCAVKPNDVMLFSDKQFQQRDEINASLVSTAEYVPRSLKADEAIDWVAGWCPLDNTTRWLPAALCYNVYPQASEPYALADSNGVAAGPSYAFAIQKGLFELIERDLVSIFHYNKLRKRGVDARSWNDPYLNDMLMLHVQKLGREIAVLDLRANQSGSVLPFYWPVYGFVAVSWHPTEHTAILGCGVHQTPQVAIQRALEECTQMLPNVLAPRCLRQEHKDGEKEAPRRSGHTRMQAHLYPDATRPLLTRSDYSGEPSIASVWQLISVVMDQGYPVILHDLMRPETGIPVVRVLAPGLRPWWPRFAPGRLYDAPVRAGEIKAALDETSLNPAPITF
jgi:ribosomal protein S12 methylthiotransferase accessory factor